LSYQTDERLKSYLDTNQLHRERLCLSVLATDKRFTDVRPRHPRGGPDGGRDIEAVFRHTQIAYGAIGFVNQANDSGDQRRIIRKKFEDDLDSVLNAQPSPDVFVFLTNVNLTIGEKEEMTSCAKAGGIAYAEIMDRERIRIALDCPDGFSARFQYLGLPLSEEEQASFFAKWGDDIESIISTGFQRVEKTLDRLLFLQEASDMVSSLMMSFELDQSYDADDIGHFRAFCLLHLKDPKHCILRIVFGSSDKSNRMWTASERDCGKQPTGIKHGVSGGQWEQYINLDSVEDNRQATSASDSCDEALSPYTKVGSSSSVGIDPVQFVTVHYTHDSWIRLRPRLSLRDLDEAKFLPILNESLSKRVKAIHIYSNGYKLLEVWREEFRIDSTIFHPSIPVTFSDDELQDPWVRIRPKDASAFSFSFFEQTPRRLFSPRQTQNSLEDKNHP